MSFIPPMLCSRLDRLERLPERRYIAEPKLDGQRAQVHINKGHTVACYSRPGRDLLRHAGMRGSVNYAGPSKPPYLTEKPVPEMATRHPSGLRGAES